MGVHFSSGGRSGETKHRGRVRAGHTRAARPHPLLPPDLILLDDDEPETPGGLHEAGTHWNCDEDADSVEALHENTSPDRDSPFIVGLKVESLLSFHDSFRDASGSSPVALAPRLMSVSHDLPVCSHCAGYGESPERQVAVVAVHVVVPDRAQKQSRRSVTFADSRGTAFGTSGFKHALIHHSIQHNKRTFVLAVEADALAGASGSPAWSSVEPLAPSRTAFIASGGFGRFGMIAKLMNACTLAEGG